MRRQHSQIVQPADAVVETGNAHVDRAVGSLQRGRRTATVFDGLPGQFEQQALLRIEPGCLARRNSEKAGVELVDSRQHTCLEGDAAPGFGALEVLQFGGGPALRRDLGDEVPTAFERVPQAGLVGQIAGETESHADDGDGIAVLDARGLRRLERFKVFNQSGVPASTNR